MNLGNKVGLRESAPVSLPRCNLWSSLGLVFVFNRSTFLDWNVSAAKQHLKTVIKILVTIWLFFNPTFQTLLSLQVTDGNRELETPPTVCKSSLLSESFASELISSLLSMPSCFPDRCASCNNVINSYFYAAGNLQETGVTAGRRIAQTCSFLSRRKTTTVLEVMYTETPFYTTRP